MNRVDIGELRSCYDAGDSKAAIEDQDPTSGERLDSDVNVACVERDTGKSAVTCLTDMRRKIDQMFLVVSTQP